MNIELKKKFFFDYYLYSLWRKGNESNDYSCSRCSKKGMFFCSRSHAVRDIEWGKERLRS